MGRRPRPSNARLMASTAVSGILMLLTNEYVSGAPDRRGPSGDHVGCLLQALYSNMEETTSSTLRWISWSSVRAQTTATWHARL